MRDLLQIPDYSRVNLVDMLSCTDNMDMLLPVHEKDRKQDYKVLSVAGPVTNRQCPGDSTAGPGLYAATCHVFTMRMPFLVPVLIAIVMVTGCTATAPSIPGTQQPLSLNQQAQFENNEYAFDAGINNIQIKDDQTIVVTLTIINTGTQGLTLSAMPSLNDPVGEAYPGQALFFSQIAPNHQSTQKGTISIPVGTLDQLGQGSTLKIRFQGTSPVPYETTWSIDLTNLPK